MDDLWLSLRLLALLALANTALLGAVVLGLPVAAGALIGAGAMAGDALASFIKRRLGLRDQPY